MAPDPGDPRLRPHRSGTVAHSRALTIAATILAVATGCDKLKETVTGRPSTSTPIVESLDLSTTPDILFQVFGERANPQILPLAALIEGAVRPIELSPDGWRRFADIYQKKGTQYRVYDDGRDIGSITVRQGMWEKPGAPVYSLPNCAALLPLATVKLETRIDVGFTVELLGTSARIGTPRPAANMSQADVRRIGREMGSLVADGQEIPRRALDALDFRAYAVNTGATPRPTIIASFIDRQGGEGEDGRTEGHVFVIADVGPDGGYTPTFSHAFRGSTQNAEYRIYLNHIDLTGDRVHEIVVEGRLTAGGSYIGILGHENGGWREIFRSRSGWCLDSEGE